MDHRSSNILLPTVVGRYQNTSGRMSDIVLEGAALLTADNSVNLEQLIKRTNDFARKFSLRSFQPLAFVGVSFGSVTPTDPAGRLWKGEFKEEDHPREPKDTPEGGEFAPKNGASTAETVNPADGLINQNVILKDLQSKVAKKIARKVLRNRLVAGLRLIAGIAADVVPIGGEAFDAYEIVQTVADAAALESEISAAEAFVEGGPRDLEDLRASAEDRSFSSAAAFKKDIIGKFYGPAGDGYDYHHIVWQGGANADNIPAELLQSTENMVRVPRLLHEAITAEYSLPSKVEGLTVREYLDTQPYDVQRAEGLKIMRNLGIIK